MGRLTPDEFRKKYAELPPNLREAYGSIKTTEILEEIGKKHGLHIDKIGELVDETGYVMLGVTPPGEFITKLEGAAGIDRTKAKEIAFDVNEQVFKPIRDALKRVHRVGEYKNDPLLNLKPETSVAPQPHTPVAAPSSLLPKPPPLREPSPTQSLPREIPAPKNPPLENLSEERLTKTFSLAPQERNYTISKNGEEEEQYSLDPYREPME